MINDATALRDILDAVSNDYESFDLITQQVLKWAADDGRTATPGDVLDLLQVVTREGYVQAYLLSTNPPYAEPVAFSPSRLEELWFRITPEGKQHLLKLAAGT